MELCHLLLYKIGRSHSAYQTLNAHEHLLDCYLNNFFGKKFEGNEVEQYLQNLKSHAHQNWCACT